jgi:hypothetical protein
MHSLTRELRHRSIKTPPFNCGKNKKMHGKRASCRFVRQTGAAISAVRRARVRRGRNPP